MELYKFGSDKSLLRSVQTIKVFTLEDPWISPKVSSYIPRFFDKLQIPDATQDLNNTSSPSNAQALYFPSRNIYWSLDMWQNFVYSQNNPTLRLPDDILRQLLESAARANINVALSLSVLSRTIQPWIEEIIYEDVNLQRESSARAFLRTIQNPTSSKPLGFFANNVKSLSICPELDPAGIVTLLSICRGVVDLTYWPLCHDASGAGSSTHRLRPGRNAIRQDPWDWSGRRNSVTLWSSHSRRATSPALTSASLSPPSTSYERLGHRREPTKVKLRTGNIDSTKFESRTLHTLSRISPRRLSVVLHEAHPIFTFQPCFFNTFFASVTHLSILNRWEQWSSWAGVGISSATMPHLTHLKFDLAVGEAPEETDSLTRWLQTVTDSPPPMKQYENYCGTDGEDARRIWDLKMNRISTALSSILYNAPFLLVCVVILRFDTSPARTAKAISRRLVVPREVRATDGVFGGEFNPANMGDVSDPRQTSSSKGFDPRLVFAWEKEVFRFSHAHSIHEAKIWKSSEAVVRAQRHLSGYTVLNCDHLL